MLIDLHAHSTASDGTTPPDGLVVEARAAGLDVVAITDHDTVAGWPRARAAAEREGIGLVVGTEISTRYEGMSVHLLSYLQRGGDDALAAQFERIRASRDGRAREMAELLGPATGLTWDDVLAATPPGATIGRPHLADALVARGVVRSRDEAFGYYVAADGPYYVRHYSPSTDYAIALVLAAGGVPVIAHPAATARGRTLSDDAIRTLAAAGLVGLEVDHRDHDDAARARLTRLAGELDLVTTGSSDFHGTGKVNRLGENLTSRESLERIVALASGGGTVSVDWRLFAEVIITLFVIMDPPGTVPVFLGLTGGMTKAERNKAALQATGVSALVIGLFAIAGPQILDYMHISVPALQASGGLLLLLVAMELLTGKLDAPGDDAAPIRANVALVPLGTPLLAGPGAIVATMLFVRQAHGDVGGWVAVGLGLLVMHLVIWAVMRFAGAVHRVLGNSGTMLVSRIAGLLLAAIAAQMIGDAIKAFFAL